MKCKKYLALILIILILISSVPSSLVVFAQADIYSKSLLRDNENDKNVENLKLNASDTPTKQNPDTKINDMQKQQTLVNEGKTETLKAEVEDYSLCGIDLADGEKAVTYDECEHNYVAEKIPPTCTKDGYIVYTCIHCNDSYIVPDLPATDHNFDSNGVCTKCGYQKADTEFKLRLSVTNSAVNVKINGVLSQTVIDTEILKVENGAKVELTALESPSNPFMFWTDENKKVRSDSISYSFIMNSSITLQAWFEDMDNGTVVIYQNTNDSKEVIASKVYYRSRYFTSHVVPEVERYGFTFIEWDKTVEEIKAKIGVDAKVVIKPKFELVKYRLEIENGKINSASDMFEPGEKVTITANTPPLGKVFLYWQDSNGNIISQSKITSITMGISDAKLTAVFGDEFQSIPSYVKINIQTDGDKLLIYNTRFINSEYKIIDYGLIYSVYSAIDLSSYLTLDYAEGYLIKTTSLGPTQVNFGVLFNSITNPLDDVYLRGYVVCEDNDGNIKRIYSNLVIFKVN